MRGTEPGKALSTELNRLSETLDYLKDHRLVERSAAMGDYLAKKLERLRSHKVVGDIRGKGLMHGVEFVTDKETKEPFSPAIRFSLQIAHECMNRGMFIENSSGCNRGQSGDMVMLGPPFIITEKQIDEIVDILDEVIDLVSQSAESPERLKQIGNSF